MTSRSTPIAIPDAGQYGVGMIFLPVEKHPRLQCEGTLERIVREEGLTLLGWRDTPVYASAIGRVARQDGSTPTVWWIKSASHVLGGRAQALPVSQAFDALRSRTRSIGIGWCAR